MRTSPPRPVSITARSHNLNISRAHYRAEVSRRIPWMLLSVLAGIAMIWTGQHYEAALERNVHLIFLIPVVVYLSDSIGSETLALFVRELALKRLKFRHLFWKEALVGLTLGFISGALIGTFSYLWLSDMRLSVAVTMAMTLNGLVAVLVGMFTPIVFAKFGADPALGTEEIATAVSDNVSLLLYLATATVFLF